MYKPQKNPTRKGVIFWVDLFWSEKVFFGFVGVFWFFFGRGKIAKMVGFSFFWSADQKKDCNRGSGVFFWSGEIFPCHFEFFSGRGGLWTCRARGLFHALANTPARNKEARNHRTSMPESVVFFATVVVFLTLCSVFLPLLPRKIRISEPSP